MRDHETEGLETWTLDWTPENMLAEASASGDSIKFSYDADGQMVLRDDGVNPLVNLADGLFQ